MMDVMLIAHTIVTPMVEGILKPEQDVDDADYLAEFTGRDCYQSHNRPNPATASNVDYLGKNLIGKEHYSVLEHATATIRFTGVSRSFTHELVRHRHFSYSQLSQRYVDITDADYVIPPLIRDWPVEHERDTMLDILTTAWESCVEWYGQLEEILHGANGGAVSHKRAREAARAVLPNMTETIIDVTGNHRAWREFLSKRLSPMADAEMQEIAGQVLLVLKGIAPNTYQDM